MEDIIQKYKRQLKVTKIVATRAIKSRHGDNYAGFTATWDSLQDDNPSGDDSQSPTSLEEARVAYLVLSMETDIAAYQSAWASGQITKEQLQGIVANIRANYITLIQDNTNDD